MQQTQEMRVPFLDLRRCPGVGNGNPFQYSCLKIPWTVIRWGTVHGATMTRTGLSTPISFFNNICLFGCDRSYLQLVVSLIFLVACGIFNCGMWALVL